ncbi:hypothetical protein ABZ907_38815 [Nonomuraea wenchangensis]
MTLQNLAAIAHPGGNRIDLTWTNPDPGTPRIRVVRRTGTHPERPGDGVTVAEGVLGSVVDRGLQGETVYYYALFPFKDSLPDTAPDPRHLISATPVEPYGFAERMYGMLPALYHRYDAEHGQLRRFLDLPGGQLDRLYSLATTALGMTDPERVDGALLPLLAEWIGWPTDYTVPVAGQRAELRAAPRLYHSVGALPALNAAVSRTTRWPGRSKEMVHAVARTNRPERLNLWSRERDPAGHWQAEPGFVSTDHACDGRPAGVLEQDGSVRIFYHARRRDGWGLRSKRWTRADGWEAAHAVMDPPGDNRHPAVARQGDRLWLFWQRFDPGLGRWLLWSAGRTGETWTEPAPLFDDDVERRGPAATADGTGGVWLFWQEGGRLRFARHDGTAWRQAPLASVPSAADDPPVRDDLFVLCHPSAPRLWVFWACPLPLPDGQTRWTIAYRTKQGLNPATADWSAVRTLPKAATDHDREPVALPSGAGVELFWSTTRHGGWSVDRAVLSGTPPVLGAVERTEPGPYTRRGPLALALPPASPGAAGGVLLVHRSNRGLLDERSAGTTTVDTRAAGKIALFGTPDDFQTYTPSRRIAREAVAIHLTPPPGTSRERVAEVAAKLDEVLADFIPLTCRPLIIT